MTRFRPGERKRRRGPLLMACRSGHGKAAPRGAQEARLGAGRCV